VFDAAAARLYQSTLGDQTFRFENNADVVPKVPPLKYEHVGHHLYFDHFGNQIPAPSPSEMADDIVDGTFENAVEHLKARNFEPEAIWDHGPQGYVKHVFINANARALP